MFDIYLENLTYLNLNNKSKREGSKDMAKLDS